MILKKNEVAALEKQAKNKEKSQAKADRERAKKEERRKKEERLNSTKALDELKEWENNLKCQNEEDQAVIQDENTTPSDRGAAEERIAERNEELKRLQTQVGERERAMPLRERVSEIFKKYGLMVTAIFLAAGVTIGAVVGTITKALKKCGEKMGDGLKTIGAKAASALPGLIGAIVSFIFKAAGSVIGFFVKYTWLLILAVVVFLFEE